jgi:hypothetical protein
MITDAVDVLADRIEEIVDQHRTPTLQTSVDRHILATR